MKENSNHTSSSGIGIAGLLGVTFIVLKLCNVIDWPWIWVLSPFWGSFAIGIIALIIFLMVALRHK